MRYVSAPLYLRFVRSLSLGVIVCLGSVAAAQEPAPEAEPKAEPAATYDLDVLDDFFGEKPKEEEAKKEADEKEKEEDKDEPKDGERVMVDVQIGPAVVAPAIRLAPALRVAPAMPVDAIEVDAAEEVDLDPRINRLTRALKLERALLRRACSLTPEQEKTLEGWDGKWLQQQLDSPEGKKLSRKLTVIPMGLPDVPFTTSRDVLVDLIATELKKVISEEQYQAYRAEVDARIAFEKQTQVDATVAILDHHLMLNSDQRVEVEKVVKKMGTLPQEPLNYLRYGQYIPNMSFASVLKHLNKYQRKIMQGLQQVQFGSSGEEDLDIIED